MTDRPDMAGCDEISGIKILDSIKYIGVTIYCDRQKTLHAAK